MVISDDGSTIYMGSSNELITFNALTNSVSKEDTTVPGKVLAVSPDGTSLIITDPVRQLIYLYAASGGSVTSTYGGVATHAEFTPDSQTVYITTGTVAPDGSITPNNQLLVHSGFTGWTSTTLAAPASDLAITVPSVGAYLAGSPTTARSYCPSTTFSPDGLSVVSNAFYPLADSATVQTDRLAATNDGMHILASRRLCLPPPLPASPSEHVPSRCCPPTLRTKEHPQQRSP
jgi:hypothetical protein